MYFLKVMLSENSDLNVDKTLQFFIDDIKSSKIDQSCSPDIHINIVDWLSEYRYNCLPWNEYGNSNCFNNQNWTILCSLNDNNYNDDETILTGIINFIISLETVYLNELYGSKDIEGQFLWSKVNNKAYIFILTNNLFTMLIESTYTNLSNSVQLFKTKFLIQSSPFWLGKFNIVQTRDLLRKFKQIDMNIYSNLTCGAMDTFSISCPNLESCPTKYSCNLKNMGILQNAISNIDLTKSNTINIINDPYKIIKKAEPYECTYAYKDISSAISAFNNDACTTFYKGLTDISNWTWNNFTQKTSPQWGWPYKCIDGKVCSAVTDGSIPWKEYHYVDKNSCNKGIYWYGVHIDGSVQIINEKCACQGNWELCSPTKLCCTGLTCKANQCQ
jgi:hypothetical protein